jgi:hypothetical protein
VRSNYEGLHRYGWLLLLAIVSATGCSRDPALPNTGPPQSSRGGPTKEDGKRAVVDIFAANGVRVKVLSFTAAKPFVYSYTDNSGENYRGMSLKYEAEIEVLNDCRLKEGPAAFWSAKYNRGSPIVAQFKQGDRKVMRGKIDFTGNEKGWRKAPVQEKPKAADKDARDPTDQAKPLNKTPPRPGFRHGKIKRIDLDRMIVTLTIGEKDQEFRVTNVSNSRS